jgi:hypothetical protein
MPDIGPIPFGDDLAAAGNVEPGEVAQQSGHRGILPCLVVESCPRTLTRFDKAIGTLPHWRRMP